MKNIITSLRLIILFTFIAGIAYPALATLYGRVFFKDKASGSMLADNGKITGSELIGQEFKSSRYFHGRLSASNYDAVSSGGTNLGPSNDVLFKRVAESIAAVRKTEGLNDDVSIPADRVTTSASGLDPHISLDAALMQCNRVAKVRGRSAAEVERLIYSLAEKRYFNITGDSYINVLMLNKTMDDRLK
jgi:potassium-transporting ATPase KdpC subunit